ncbi:YesL family protein [Saliterribacillus persicus]|uniref:Putative membrane protein YesL n=1 Tax=Saliterribacillus persicus TaxID=930114 RepID=A0A368XG90_9BACI|nr:YesL family protein [Saliterribacillus persicus]RCW67010.1 putative membrane protein YesL [Saliterribacillus persicus]
MTALNTSFEWITKVAYLNIIWITMTLLGLGIFGIFPATAAVFVITRKWITGQKDIPILSTFWKYYKEGFLQANVLGFLLVIFSYILYLDFLFITVADGKYTVVLTIPFLFVGILFLLTALYVFPVYSYYEMKGFKVFKSAFFIMVLNPMPTLIMVLGMLGLIYILWHFQGLALFFSISIMGIIIMMPAEKAFKKVHDKQRQFRQKTAEANK